MALGLMIGAPFVSGARALLWPPATPYQPYFMVILVIVVVIGVVFNGALALAIALRQRWAFIVYAVLVAIGVPVALVNFGRQGGHVGSIAAYLGFLAVEIATIALLLSRPTRAWFALPRSNRDIPAQWYPDPAGRHEHRYWDGIEWTSCVADQGAQSVDPLPDVSPTTTAAS